MLETGQASATALSSQSDCVGTPPVPVVHLAWEPSRAGSQRVDVAAADVDGFDTGDFRSSGELDAAVAVLDWLDVEGEAPRRWRVLTRTADGWVPSAPATFEGPGCVGTDLQD